MKKIIFLLGIMAVMASCGSKTKPAEEVTEPAIEEAVTEQVEAVADSIEVAVSDSVVAE